MRNKIFFLYTYIHIGNYAKSPNCITNQLTKRNKIPSANTHPSAKSLKKSYIIKNHLYKIDISKTQILNTRLIHFSVVKIARKHK